MSIQLNFDNIRLRPSAIDGFSQCSWQWAKVFLEGITTIPNGRAAIGTSIHRAVEVMWQDAIETGVKDVNISKLTDAAIEDLQEQNKQHEIAFDDGENLNTAAVEIVRGTEAFVEDIAPFTPIPKAVEEFYKVEISDHPIVAEVGGTVDYIGDGVIADVKTSKRKPSPANYTTQQSIYKFLANANGHNIDTNLIQGVVLKKSGAEGTILTMDTDVQGAKNSVNLILDTLDVFHKNIVKPEVLFRTNTKYYLCSNKYCALHGTKDCPATYRPANSGQKIKL